MDVVLPIEELNEARFLDVYREGKTSSDPETAVELVFGEPRPALAAQAQRIMAQRTEAL